MTYVDLMLRDKENQEFGDNYFHLEEGDRLIAFTSCYGDVRSPITMGPADINPWTTMGFFKAMTLLEMIYCGLDDIWIENCIPASMYKNMPFKKKYIIGDLEEKSPRELELWN